MTMPATVGPGQADEDLALLRDACRSFFDAELVPQLDRWRAAGAIPRAFLRRMGDLGLLCPSTPQSYGGAGGDYRYNAVVIEEAARSGITPAGLMIHSDIVANYILHWGSEAQKQALLPAMARGEIWAAIAMTEPHAGSDLKALSTSAARTSGGFVLNGQKTFITNGQSCDLVIVAAKTDAAVGSRAISLFVVDTALPGFRRGRRLHKMGGAEQDTSELFFDDLRLPADALLGEEGQGFEILMRELPIERLSVAVSAVASSEKALALTIDYVKDRQAFGKALIEFQNTSFKLAELRAAVKAARALVESCVDRLVAGRLSAVDGAEVKLFTTRLQCRVMDECLQLHGGYGWMDEYLISRMYADARVQRIYAGSDEIMQLIIARDL